MQNKRFWKSNHYHIKVINGDGVANVSVIGSGLHYRIAKGGNEPEGEIYGKFKDKKYNRGKILRKLGLWT